MSGSTPGAVRVRSAVAATMAVACVAALAAIAARSPGYAGSSVDSTTRVVWVTNASEFLVGRINRQIDELDSAAALSSADFDVVQDGREVFAVDSAAHQLRRIDPATVTLSDPLDLPDHAVVALGSGVLAIGDVSTGRVWVRPADDAGSGHLTDSAPTATVAPGLVLAVGTDGSVAATAPGQNRLTVIGGTAGSGDVASHAVPLNRTLSAATGTDPAPVALAMVGSRPVVLDRPAGVLVAGGRSLALPSGTTGATLQQSGPDADTALVATRSALLRISLAGGAVDTVAAGTSGTPAAPVWLDGCAHAAWSGTRPTYLAWCGAQPTIRAIPVTAQGTGHDALVFRVNESEIVLNDITTGDAYLLDEQMTVVNNWSQVAPPRDQQSEADNSGRESDSEQASLSRTNCNGGIAAPAAKADTFGVRAGRPVVLPVTANDATTDCSVVTIDSVSGWSSADGAVAIVDGGRSLQVTAPAGASGELPTLRYRITDGAQRSSEATVQVSVIPDDEHPQPARLQGSAIMVGVGGTVTDDVLSDWYSPAGDPLWLTAASAQGQDLAIGFQPGGAITVHDTGTGGPGKRTVTFALTDGFSVERGTLTVEVVAPADAAPLASPVFATTPAGRPVTVPLLDSVLVPGTDPAVITQVTADPVQGQPPPGLTVGPPSASGAVTIRASAAGEYLLHYRVSAGSLDAVGVLRLLVTAGRTAPPVAVTDIGYLAPDGQVRLDLTANDLAGGQQLAVQQVDVDPESPLVVTVSDLHVAHVSASRALPAGGSWFSYTASDGSASATGWVHIVPVPEPAGQGPIAAPAQLTVRAGDAGTLPIDTVAQDPDGRSMTVQPFTALPAGQGLLFAAGNSIRYLAPDTPPANTVSTVYTVTDTAGRSASAALRITVLPRGGNHPPATPPVVTARVFAGGQVTIPLPLDGLDPDGDWVTATGITDSGTLGTASILDPGTIRYTAFDRPGSDTVRYTVSDPSGARAAGRLTVVVVPEPDITRPPVAPDLKITVATGRSIGVNALAAVSDPAGLAVRFAPSGAVQVPARSGVTARIAGGLLVVTAGSRPAVVPVGYTVVNSRGLSASGVVTVTVSRHVDPVPPVATDVFVTPDMVSADGRSAVVDISEAVSNPGGLPGELHAAVATIDSSAASATGRLQITVPLTGRRQVIAYRVTNAQRLTASAFIVVPTRTALLPNATDPSRTTPDPLRPSGEPLTVDAGAVNLVDIGRYVTGAPSGRTIGVPADARMNASTGAVDRRDATHVRWHVPDGAGGPGWLSVQVTDGPTTPVTVRIPATIKPMVPPPPEFHATEVDVAAGGSKTVQLTPLTTAGKPGQHLTYAGPSGAGHGVRGQLSGSTLTVTASGTAAKGSAVTLRITVSDGIHPPVPGRVIVRVVASTAPRAWIPGVQRDGLQGVTQRVDVLAGARNPVSAKGPLKVVGASVITGSGRVSYTGSGTVAITPSDHQVGRLVVQVSVADATGDPDRVVTGTVTVTVVGRPGRVGGVDVVATGDRLVELAWTAPSDNGRRITSYTVRATAGSFRQTCAASPTRCRITGLTNNRVYRFTVTAHNSVGDSPPSAPSAGAAPDVAPEPPAAPVLSFGDGTITATWKPPVDHGSPVTSYLVSISPAPASGPATATVRGVTGHTFGHLTNGVAYRVSVVARNSSGTDSEPSAAASMVPAAPPATPGAPGLAYDHDAATVTVTWQAVSGNGDDAIGYVVAWTGDDGSNGTVPVKAGKPLSASISGAKLGVTYTATVTASNKAGRSAAGPAGSVRAFTAVGAPGDVTATATGADQTVTASWQAPAYSGWDISGYQYQIDGQGAWVALPAQTTATIRSGALTNGAKHTIAIRACTAQSQDACGSGATSDAVVPYGPPGQVTGLQVTSVGDKSFTLSWAALAGNGRSIAGYQWTEDGGTTWTDTGSADPTKGFTGTNGRTYTVAVRGYYGDDGGNATGAASSAVTVTPYGPVGAPSVRASGSSQSSVTFTWSAPADNGLGPYRYEINGGSPTSATSTSISTSCGKSVSISVVAVDSQGHTGPAGTASGTASACPPTYQLGILTRGVQSWPSPKNVSDGQPLPAGTYGIQCKWEISTIGTDGGEWFRIAPGYTGAGRYTPSNNFSNYTAIRGAVPSC